MNIDSIKKEAFKALFGAQLLKLATLVAEYPTMEPISKKLLKYYDHFTERVLESVYPLRGNVNVLNHGDLWVNNMFFKYESNSTKFKAPTEVRFVSFTYPTFKVILKLETLQIADRFSVVLLW